ncbi:MAG: glycosyltransferase family 39 protein [Candidatus Glassbacteria bacterium]
MQTDDKLLLRSLWAVALASFVLKVALAFYAGAWNSAQEFEYSDIARNLLAGKGYVYHDLGVEYKVFGFPLYPLLLWLLLTVFGAGAWPAQIVEMLASSAAGVLAGQITSILAPRRRLVAVAAAVLAAFHPGVGYYSIFKVHELPLVFFWSLWAVLAAVKLAENPGIGKAAWFGMVLGTGFLLRPTLVLAGPAAFVTAILVMKRNARKYIPLFALAAAVSASVALPWWVRNYQATGRIILISTTSWSTLWSGFNPHATGTNYTEDGRPQLSASPDVLQESSHLSDTGQNDYFKDLVSGYVRQDPGRIVTLFIKKCEYFWWFTPTQGKEYRQIYLYIYAIYYLALIGGLLFLPARFGKMPETARFIAWTALVFLVLVMAVHAASYVEGRHRWGVEGLIICLSLTGYAGIFGKRNTGK